ncbi:MAG: M23 family metallopeptidase [Bacteroidales bacterium]|nr:M23 family metallopeptidase [Bacteroidales bacterium]
MAQETKEKWYKKLRHKYRLVILHDETYEERISFRLSRMNVFVVLVSLSVFLIFVTTYIIAFTPLREYIPGYTDISLTRKVIELDRKADSLQRVFQQKEAFLVNLRRIIDGYNELDDTPIATTVAANPTAFDTIKFQKSVQDSLLRAEFESGRFNLVNDPMSAPENLRVARRPTQNFFVPLKGTLTNKFDPIQKHFGVDIVAKSNEAIKSTLDGTVVFADWTLDKGYVIGLLHAGNLVSVYKHNSVLLKKEGDVVKAGEAIAIIGETGELSSGPHLHFELWLNSSPVDPEVFITF